MITWNQRAAKARAVRIGGWVGGDQKRILIFFNLKYINMLDALITNIASKIVYSRDSHQIKSYEHFMFWNFENLRLITQGENSKK